MNYFKRIADYFIFDNLLIAVAGACITLQTLVQLDYRVVIYPYVLAFFFGTYSEYSFHRYLSLRKKTDISNLKKNLPFALGLISALAFLVIVFFMKLKVILLLIPFGLITLAYSFPFFKHKRTRWRLRDIPMLKIFLICIVWSVPSVLVPLAYFDQELITKQSLFLILERCLFIFAITIPFDIKDAKVDSSNNVLTLPLLVGQEAAWIIAELSIVLYMILCMFDFYIITKSGSIFIAELLGGAFVLFLLKNNKIRESKYYHYGWLDGSIIVQFLLLLILKLKTK